MKKHVLVAVCLMVGWAVMPANGSVLTFDPPGAGTINGGVNQAYGDNMPGTPDVTVSYNAGANPETQLTLWDNYFGNLTNVIAPSSSGTDITITFTAGGGHSVTVAGFDMGVYFGTYDIPWTAKDGSDATLASGTVHVVDGATHAHADITGATADVVKLTVETSTVGGNAIYVAMDNVAFYEDGITVTGKVVLDNYTGDGGGSPNLDMVGVRVSFDNTTDNSTIVVKKLLLNSDGTFSVAGIPSGMYNVAVKTYAHLQTVLLNQNITTDPFPLGGPGAEIHLTSGDIDGNNVVNATDLLIVQMNMFYPEGDCNHDGYVTEADLTIVMDSLDKLKGEAGYDERADLDSDEEITSTDLSIVLNAMGG
ncbi:MAG: dockerin type I domain-containing protein [Phycisphaerae bacterium]